MYGSNDSATGEHLANIWVGYAEIDTIWIITERVNGEVVGVVGVEEGVYAAKFINEGYEDSFVVSDATTFLWIYYRRRLIPSRMPSARLAKLSLRAFERWGNGTTMGMSFMAW